VYQTEMRPKRVLTRRGRVVFSIVFLALAPLAWVSKAYGGAFTLVGGAGWILASQRTVPGLVRPHSRADFLASMLVLVGVAGFVITFVVIAFA